MKQKLKYWIRLITFGLIMFYVLGITGFSWLHARASIRSAQHDICCGSPADFDAEYEAVKIVTDDGITLSGWYIPPQNGAIIILFHGYGGDRVGTLKTAEMLYDNAYGVLMYDQRASGESEGEVLTWGWWDVADVAAAIRFIEDRGDIQADGIGVWGCSTGAEIAMGAGAHYEAIQAVIADGPFYTTAGDAWPPYDVKDFIGWPIYPLYIEMMKWKSGTAPAMSLREAASQIAPRPLLLIAAGNEGYEQYRAQHYFESAGEPKDYWVVPDADHCAGPGTQPEEYETRMINFLNEALLTP